MYNPEGAHDLALIGAEYAIMIVGFMIEVPLVAFRPWSRWSWFVCVISAVAAIITLINLVDDQAGTRLIGIRLTYALFLLCSGALCGYQFHKARAKDREHTASNIRTSATS